MTDFDRVIYIANIVRDVFEKISNEEGGDKDLCGYCLRASLQLVRVAQNLGIKAEIAQNEGHTFALFNDIIIDPTATQFGVEEKVMVIPLDELKNDLTWKILLRSSDPYAAVRKWTSDCNCSNCQKMRTSDPELVDNEIASYNKELIL